MKLMRTTNMDSMDSTTIVDFVGHFVGNESGLCSKRDLHRGQLSSLFPGETNGDWALIATSAQRHPTRYAGRFLRGRLANPECQPYFTIGPGCSLYYPEQVPTFQSRHVPVVCSANVLCKMDAAARTCETGSVTGQICTHGGEIWGVSESCWKDATHRPDNREN